MNLGCAPGTWSSFHPAKEHQTLEGIQHPDINEIFSNLFDPFLNSPIREQCEINSRMDIRIRSNKQSVDNQIEINQMSKTDIICNHKDNIAAGRGPCPTFEIRFCCEKNENDFEWVTELSDDQSFIDDEYQGRIRIAKTRTGLRIPG